MTSEQDINADRNGDERDQFIPVRKSAVLSALVEHGLIASAEAREQFGQLCRLLGAIFHYDHPAWDNGYWVIPRFEDVQRVSRDWTAFKNRAHSDWVKLSSK